MPTALLQPAAQVSVLINTPDLLTFSTSHYLPLTLVSEVGIWIGNRSDVATGFG